MKKLLLTAVLLVLCASLQAKENKHPLMKSKMTESGQIVLNGSKCPFEDLDLKGDDYWKGESAEYDFIDQNGKIKSMGCWVTSGKDDILAQDFEGRHLAFKKNDFSKDVAFDENIKDGEPQFPTTKPTKAVSQRPRITATGSSCPKGTPDYEVLAYGATLNGGHVVFERGICPPPFGGHKFSILNAVDNFVTSGCYADVDGKKGMIKGIELTTMATLYWKGSDLFKFCGKFEH